MRLQLVRLIKWFQHWVLLFLRMLFFLTITSLTSIWVGVPTAITRISDTWLTEATAAGVPLAHHRAIRVSAMVISSITLFLGWLVLASLTLWLLNLIT